MVSVDIRTLIETINRNYYNVFHIRNMLSIVSTLLFLFPHSPCVRYECAVYVRSVMHSIAYYYSFQMVW